MRPPEGAYAGLGQPGKADLPLLDQLPDCASHVLDRHGPIDSMLIEQVDPVGAQPAQATLDRFPDMLGPAVHADDPVAREPRAELRGDHHSVASALQCPTEQLLVDKGAIVLRRVEEGAS